MQLLSIQMNIQSLGDTLLRLIAQDYRQTTQLAPIRQVTIQHGEVYPVASGYHTLRMISGKAWLTQSGEDYVLEAGQLLLVDAQYSGALVSALGQQSVTFELS